MKTERFEIIMGVVAGYFHNNEKSEGDKSFGEKLQEVQESVFNDTGLYISCIWKPAKVSYHVAWGCPVGGEDVFQISGTRNPAFVQDKEVYRKVVELLTKKLMETFHQKTATLEWQETELNYLQS